MVTFRQRKRLSDAKVAILSLLTLLISFSVLQIKEVEAEDNQQIDSLRIERKGPLTQIPTHLTLSQAIRIALKESPLLASKSNMVSAFKQRERAAKGSLLPKVDAYSSYRRLNEPQLVVPMKSFERKNAFFSRDHYSYGLSLKVPVFEGGRLWTNITMAELSKAISKEDFRLTSQELIYNITNVFNEILFLKDLENAQNETLSALKKLRADAKTRLRVGRLAPVDLMRIDTQVAEQESSLESTRQERVRALETLAQLMGRQPQEVKDIRGRLMEHGVNEVEKSPHEISTLVSQRPDVKKAWNEMKLLEKTIRYQKGLHLPRLDLVGDYGRKAGSGFEGDEEQWSAGLVVSLNIFSGGVISSKVKEAEERYLASRNRYENLRLSAIKEVMHAISEMKEASKRLQAARSALKAAKESFRIEEVRYRTGVGTVTDSLLSQSAWLRARANVYRALFDCEKALMDFRLATGRVGI